ncbi:hypothetical protein FVE85_8518 [Porphyridium purpureum]|uniref:Uncharacterized protein n=1 Tax=Porphyridium purpureum TaxID=35688 RepID=A0A5J4YGR3_PORPP|nr:hypothetical protein FVE85_8518 [Porphyridium purpureum]|eukprot:POR7965..scf257_31
MMGIRIPEPDASRNPFNLPVIPFDDFRPSSARWIGEWKPATKKYPIWEHNNQWGTLLRDTPKWNHTIPNTSDGSPKEHQTRGQKARKVYRTCSEKESAALQAGYEAMGPQWSAIGHGSDGILSGIGSKELRSHAAAMGLLGENEKGLGKDRRGKAAGDARTREKISTLIRPASPIPKLIATSDRLNPPFAGTDDSTMAVTNDSTASLPTATRIVESLVAEVLQFNEAMRSERGRLAFQKELKTLLSAGALPFGKVTSHEMAARVPGARFVKIKPLMVAKNA